MIIIRRWNTEPVVYPWQISYATFNNNPVYFTDPQGLSAVSTGGACCDWFKKKGGSADGRRANKTGYKTKFGDTKVGKFFSKIGNALVKAANGLSGIFERQDNNKSNPEGPPPGWETDCPTCIPEVVLNENKPQKKRWWEPKVGVTWTDENVTDPNAAPRHDMPLNHESVNEFLSINGGPTGLPGHSWSYHIEEIVNRLKGIYQEATDWLNRNNGPLTKPTKDKDVRQQVEKSSEGFIKKEKVITTKKGYRVVHDKNKDGLPDTTDEVNEDIFQRYYKNDTNLIQPQ